MQVKTSELTNEALDCAVALAMGGTNLHFDTISSWWITIDGREVTFSKGWADSMRFRPSQEWACGGTIIERECIGLWPSDSREGMWAARPDYKAYPERLTPAYGSTPLIAAMRCYVASKLGETVDIPRGLI